MSDASFRDNELEELDAELKLQNNAEGIKTTLTKVFFDLKESEQPVLQVLKQIGNQLQGYASLHPTLTELIQRLQSTQIELQDIAEEKYKIQAVERPKPRVNLKKVLMNNPHELLQICLQS